MLGLAPDAEIDDFEDCLFDFMEYHFNMVLEDNSAKEIGKALLTIRRELYGSIQDKGELASVELEKLRAFNELKN